MPARNTFHGLAENDRCVVEDHSAWNLHCDLCHARVTVSVDVLLFGCRSSIYVHIYIYMDRVSHVDIYIYIEAYRQ
jgi:hypothetical protein